MKKLFLILALTLSGLAFASDEFKSNQSNNNSNNNANNANVSQNSTANLNNANPNAQAALAAQIILALGAAVRSELNFQPPLSAPRTNILRFLFPRVNPNPMNSSAEEAKAN